MSQQPMQDGLFSLLKTLALAARCDGVALYRSEELSAEYADIQSTDWASQEGMQTAAESYPSGLRGNRTIFSPGLLALLRSGEGALSTTQQLLPAAITRWLGWRPQFVSTAACVAANTRNTLFLWWKAELPAGLDPAAIVHDVQPALRELIVTELLATEASNEKQRLQAILANVTLGMVLTDSLRGSLVNTIAAVILAIPQETRETSVVAAAMTALRSACEVMPAERESSLSGSPSGKGSDHFPWRSLAEAVGAEYWISPGRGLALRVESHAIGDPTAPARFWIFTDVKPLWDSSEELKSSNDLLQQNLLRLADEVEKRHRAEAELGRYNRGLQRENRKLEEARLESDLLANQDALTGLANRRCFHQSLQNRIQSGRALIDRVAIMFIDLDNFKLVNDTLGHDRGDELLRAVAAALLHSLRGQDTIARLGGDEFAVATTLTGEQIPKHLATLTDRVLRALHIPVETAGEPIQVAATIGIAVWPEDAENAEGLLIAADKAMYRGKRQGRGQAVFYSSVRDELQQQGQD